MYINDFYFNSLENNEEKSIKIDKNRIQYYKDLYSRYENHFLINENSNIYSYTSVASVLFNEIKRRAEFCDVDWILFPKHGYSWDGAHVAQELYLKNKYRLTNNLLDVRDCGSLCVYQALTLGKSLSQNILISSVETDVIFNKFPYIGFIKTSNNKYSDRDLFFENAHFFYSKDNFSMNDMIKFFFNKIKFSVEDTVIFDHASDNLIFESGFLYKILTLINKIYTDKKYFLIIDRKMGSQQCVFLFLRRKI